MTFTCDIPVFTQDLLWCGAVYSLQHVSDMLISVKYLNFNTDAMHQKIVLMCERFLV